MPLLKCKVLILAICMLFTKVKNIADVVKAFEMASYIKKRKMDFLSYCQGCHLDFLDHILQTPCGGGDRGGTSWRIKFNQLLSPLLLWSWFKLSQWMILPTCQQHLKEILPPPRNGAEKMTNVLSLHYDLDTIHLPPTASIYIRYTTHVETHTYIHFI